MGPIFHACIDLWVYIAFWHQILDIMTSILLWQCHDVSGLVYVVYVNLDTCLRILKMKIQNVKNGFNKASYEDSYTVDTNLWLNG